MFEEDTQCWSMAYTHTHTQEHVPTQRCIYNNTHIHTYTHNLDSTVKGKE